MFTPQQIEQIAFGKATFGGYNMEDVDAFLEPLTEDYITLYKENALLKSKMKVLVSKLEEYRDNEAQMKDAIVNAQKTCDMMVRDAEAKCTQMLSDANQAATENAKNADALIEAENARVEEAKRAATGKIEEIQEQIRSCLQALDRIKAANAPSPSTTVSDKSAFDFDRAENKAASHADAMADEISANLQAMMGPTDEPAPAVAPKHPQNDTTTGKFASMKLQFGKNYDPTSRN